MAQDIERHTVRLRAANVMQCRLPWSTALANAEDLDRAGLLADRRKPDPLRELAEWLVSLDGPWRQEESSSAISQAIARAREALGRTEGQRVATRPPGVSPGGRLDGLG